MGKSITSTIVFQAQSLNYGEGIGNIAELKKLTRGDGNYYSIASRQAILYDFRRLGNEFFGWNLQTVDRSKGTIQYRDEFSIKDSEEMDLFGYMKTEKKGGNSKGGSSIRSAVVRVSNAISLEPYRSDMDFLSNKGLADRIGEHPNLANSEQHLSYYTYTFTIDLDKVGVDGEIQLPKEEKIKRIGQFLELAKILNRNIRGRQENLSPLFIIGGMYDIANPFFLGRIKIEKGKKAFKINMDSVEDVLETNILDKSIKKDTKVGLISGIFENQEDIKDMFDGNVGNIEKYFKSLKDKVREYYGE